jgi:uncharacterized membrane protein
MRAERLRGASLVCALLGLAVSAYLSVEHFTTPTLLACPATAVVNCQRVTTSPQSMVLGIPVAVLGLLYFAALAGLTAPAAWRSRSRELRLTRLAAAAAGVVFAIYLIYVELFVVNAICLWCTAVHAIALAQFAVISFATAEIDEGRRIRV